MPELIGGVASDTKHPPKRRHVETARELSKDALKYLLAAAGKDDKAEALNHLLSELKPILLELLKNKSWSSRKTAQFFKSRKIMLRACDIDAFLKSNPFDGSDSAALQELKRNISQNKPQGLMENEKHI